MSQPLNVMYGCQKCLIVYRDVEHDLTCRRCAKQEIEQRQAEIERLDTELHNALLNNVVLNSQLAECQKLLRELLASPLCSAEFCERAAAAAGGGE